MHSLVQKIKIFFLSCAIFILATLSLSAQAIVLGQAENYLVIAKKLITEEKNVFKLKNRIQALLVNADSSQKSALNFVLGKVHMDLLEFALAKSNFVSALPLVNAHLELLRIALLEADRAGFEVLLAKLPATNTMNVEERRQLKSIISMAQLLFEDFLGLEKTIGDPQGSEELALSYLLAQKRVNQSLTSSSIKKLDQSYANSLWALSLRFSVNERIGFDLARGFLTGFSNTWPQNQEETEAPSNGLEVLQVGIFTDKKNAESLLAKLSKFGFLARLETLDSRKPVRFRIVVDISRGLDPQDIILSLKEKGIEAFLSK